MRWSRLHPQNPRYARGDDNSENVALDESNPAHPSPSVACNMADFVANCDAVVVLRASLPFARRHCCSLCEL